MTATANTVQQRELVARAVRICNDAGVMDVNGHVSARDADDPNVFWINDRHAGRATLTVENIVPYDIRAGRRVGEGVEPPSEVHIHREIYLRRPDVQSIVHSHPETVLALSAVGALERPSTCVGTFLPEAGAPVFDSPVLINTLARGEAIAAALGDAPAIVLRQHGAVTVGSEVRESVVRMICLEDNARKQYGATVMGGVKYLAGGELATLAVENWTNAVEKFWRYHDETAERNGALAGILTETPS
jgi:ribulose-5-phosphate 4-epimerase/fuculose-1-phosphate aldolase